MLYEKTHCKKCDKEIKNIDVFTGGICIECYEKEYEKMSDNEKIPIFGKNLIN